ncbi:MAG: PQQ-binding-like beta-propeller repeat protein [Nitriliruptoraceae bacterium]
MSDGTRVARTDASGIARLDCEGPFVYLVSRIPGADTIWYLPSDAPDLCFTASSSPADEISFVHVTDLHVTDPFAGGRPRRFEVACDRAVAELARMEAPASEQRVRALFDQLPRLAPSAGFVVATGDLTDRASDAEFEAYRRASRGSLPVVDVPGNHDHRVDDEGHLDVSAYERHLGPRWYSFDVGPVHLVVLDWFSWTLRRDDDQQRAWLAADLTLAGGRPWVLLAHDRIRDLDLTALPRPPVAAFTGHWHATRIVHHGGTAHVATGSPLFAGLDRTVPSLREATISEHGLRLRSVVPPTGTPLEGGRPGTSLARTRDALDAPAGWARRLPGSGMSGPPVAAGEFALITSTDEDRGRSTVTALEHMTGEPVWQVTFAEQFRDSPAVEGDLAVLASVSGTLHCLEVRSGTKRWSRAALDPLLSWVTNTPSIGRGLVLSGDASAVVACRLEDGTLVWQRRDLGQHLNHVNYTAPTVVGGHVVVGFWPQAPGLIVLDANSGQVQTPDNAVEHAATAGWGDGIPRAPRADLVRIAEDVLVMEAGRLVRRTLPDATERWSVPAPGLFAIAAPVVARDVVLLVDHGTALQARDAGTGRWLWRFDQSGDAALPRLPYARVGAALASAPALADDVAVLGLSDGRLRVVRLDSGAVVGRGSVPGALLEHPVVIGDTIVTLDLDGVARGVPLPAVRQEPEAVAGQAVTA